MPPASKVKLRLCFDNKSPWPVALSIPLAQCKTFATVAPLKWLRFVGFTIYGREGRLSTSMNGPELDYDAEIEARVYYFISDGEPSFADVDALDNRTTDVSAVSTRRAAFGQRVIARDGTCVMSAEPVRHCHACHLLPHSKGDEYMSTLYNYRGETYGLMDPLDDINDTRNGILLYAGFHQSLDAGEIAFLRTPNFALTIDDIPNSRPPPNAGSPENRLTLQYIQPSRVGPVLSHFSPHNSDARQPQDTSQWPPAIIVDLSYAAAVLQAWGTTTFIKHVRAKSKDSYYGMESDDDEDVSGDPTAQEPHQPTARTIRYDRRSNNNAQAVNQTDHRTREDMFDVVMALWKRAAREAARDGERLPGSDSVDVADNEQKIQTWLQSMKDSTS